MTIPSPAPDPIAHKNRPFDAGSVWVVIPTYNEKLNIVRLIAEIFSLPLPHLSLLVVDDNSPDGTGALVTQLQSQYPKLFLLSRPKKNGLGRAYVDGFDYARARILSYKWTLISHIIQLTFRVFFRH